MLFGHLFWVCLFEGSKKVLLISGTAPSHISVEQRFLPVACFSLLVVAVDPSYFNNNQGIVRCIAFWCLRLVGVAGWLWRFLQVEQ
jgi:hypothetical protein